MIILGCFLTAIGIGCWIVSIWAFFCFHSSPDPYADPLFDPFTYDVNVIVSIPLMILGLIAVGFGIQILQG